MGTPRAPQPGAQAEAEARAALTLERFGPGFVAASRRYLGEEYPAKIDRALEGLTHDDVWWRPSPVTNSIGHLLRHLSGNVGQWILHGIGGAPDRRDRASEFSVPRTPVATLRADLRSTLVSADEVLRDLDPARLTSRVSVQGMGTTIGEAIYHVVEHFSMHTGQILWIAKVRSGRDLGFYEVDDRGDVIGTHW